MMTGLPAWLEEDAPGQLLAACSRHHIDIRFVGGCVRDHLMGRPVHDLDAATPATPEQVMQALKAEDIRVLPTGLKHGTVTAIIDGRHIEITTLRKDAACDGRHADVTFTNDWQEDAKRRDFTFNALYMDAEGTVYDYTGGQDDLKTGRLRFIGQAHDRIREDYLRILRFFRFYATHATPPADTEALAACEAEAAGIDGLSGERIQVEMLKLLAAPNPLPALRLMEKHGILCHIIPGPVTLDYLNTLLKYDIPPDPLLRLSVIVKSDVNQLASRWRLSNTDTAYIKALTAGPPIPVSDAQERDIKAWIRRHGTTIVTGWLWCAIAQGDAVPPALFELARHWQSPAFPVTGNDLLAHGIPAGKEMGEMLRTLEARWEASDYILSKDALLEEVTNQSPRHHSS